MTHIKATKLLFGNIFKDSNSGKIVWEVNRLKSCAGHIGLHSGLECTWQGDLRAGFAWMSIDSSKLAHVDTTCHASSWSRLNAFLCLTNVSVMMIKSLRPTTLERSAAQIADQERTYGGLPNSKSYVKTCITHIPHTSLHCLHNTHLITKS